MELNVTVKMRLVKVKFHPDHNLNAGCSFIIPDMKHLCLLACALSFLAAACQPLTSSVTVIDGDKIQYIESNDRALTPILEQAGITPGPHDRILINGVEAATVHSNLPQPLTIQICRAMTLTLVTPVGQQIIETSARTVGEALNEAGVTLTQDDLLDPPAGTPIIQALSATYTPARDLTVFIGERVLNIHSAAGTVGEALAEAGVPLMGLDTSTPQESEVLPADGQIRVVRAHETFETTFESIPFEEKVTYSPDLPFGQKETIQPGVEGIAMIREHIRYEDGNEVSRTTEEKVVLREPQIRIVQSGEKIVLAPVGGSIPYDYWYATEMYATVYSPCESGIGGCSYGTASGAHAGQGIVAVDYSIYNLMAGMQVYVPGYGVATIGDTGGGPIIETAFGVPRTKWIDLGFNEGEIRDMTGWVTVYFLAPAPAEIPYFLK
jgi:uncharacterized protein YabE (DUF348 family)